MAKDVTPAQLYQFIREHRFGVVATNSRAGAPEAALVYLGVTPELELIFHALQSTRKCANLRRDPQIAVVIGWDAMQTVQYEGVADEPKDHDLENIKKAYLDVWPGALQRIMWPDITFFRVRPKWIRFSDYGPAWHVNELDFPLGR